VAAGIAALDDVETMRANAATLRAERTRLADGLAKCGFSVFPSHANFVAAVCTDPSAPEVADALAREGILIRTFGDPRLADWVRISLGSPEQNARVLAEIERLVGSKTQ
jgi:histidinol-phosphate aminotransferase